jgi:hypothetical protein
MTPVDRIYQSDARRRRWERYGDPQDEPDELGDEWLDREELNTDDHELDERRLEHVD